MTEIPDAAMLMSMVKNAGAGFTDNKWDELLALVDDQAEAIQRVRQLGDEECECLNYEACCEHEGIQRAIKALDGEQS